MEKPKRHLLVCAGFRAGRSIQGTCPKRGSTEYLPYLEEEIEDREMENTVISSTGCLNMCENGPVMIVYPENDWYGKISSEDALGNILDALAEGRKAEEYLLTE